MKLDPYLTLRNITQNGLKTLSSEAIKLLEENIAKKLLDIGLANNFLTMTPKAPATKAKVRK